MAELVSKRYAQSLFEVALELDKLDDIKEEISSVASVLESEPKLKTIFQHPKLSKNEKKDIVNSLFKDRVSKETLNFLYIIIDKRREKYITDINKNYIGLYNENKDILQGTVTTAISMNSKELERLQKELSKKLNKTVLLENKVDKTVLGGVLVRLEDKVIDYSIKGQLENISKKLNS